MAEEATITQGAPVQEKPKLRKVYDYLKKKGVVNEPTYEDFEGKVKNPKKLKKVFDYLKSDRDAKIRSENFDEFKTKMFPESEQKLPIVPQQPIQQPEQQPQAPERNFQPVQEDQPLPDMSPEAMQQGLAQQINKDFNASEQQVPKVSALDKLNTSDTRQKSPEEIRFESEIKRNQTSAARQVGTGEVSSDPIVDVPTDVNDFSGRILKTFTSGLTSIPKSIAIVAKPLDDFFGIGKAGQPIENYEMYQLGDVIDKKALEWGITATDPKHDDSFWQGTVPDALGSVAAMALFGRPSPTNVMAPAIASERQAVLGAVKDIGKSMVSPSGVVGGTSAAVPEFEAAKAQGLSDDEAFKVFLKNYLVGQTEAIPFERALTRINKLSGGKLVEYVKAGTKGGLEEGIQETIQSTLTNKIAQGSYDPERDTFQDVLKSAGAGFFVGFILPGIGKAMNSMTPEQRAQTKKVINDRLTELKNKTTPNEKEPVVAPPSTEQQGSGAADIESKAGIETPASNDNLQRDEGSQTPEVQSEREGQTEIPTEQPASTEFQAPERVALAIDTALSKPLPDGVTGFTAHFDPSGYRTEIRKEDGKFNFYLTNDSGGANLPSLTKSKLSKPIASFNSAKEASEYIETQSASGSVSETPTTQSDVKVKANNKGRKSKVLTSPEEEVVANAATPSITTEPLVKEDESSRINTTTGSPESGILESDAISGGPQQGDQQNDVDASTTQEEEVSEQVVQEAPKGDEEVSAEPEFGYEKGEIPSGTEVKFDWLGHEKTGKVIGYKNKRIKIKGRDGTVFPKDPKDVKVVNMDQKRAKPHAEEKIVAYNSKRKKPIGIVSNGLTGGNGFMFQTDLGKKISGFFQKQFTSKGFLPQQVFDRWIKTKGEIGKYESQVKFTLGDIKSSIKDEYKGKPTDEQITDLNLALQGKQPTNPLPPKTAALIQDMRAQIDNLSRRFIDEGIVSGDLSAKFTKNMGTYLTRSYRKFDDPFWSEFVPDEVRNKAEAFLRGKFPNHSSEEIDGLINYLLHDPAAPGALLKGSKLGSKDLSILKKRGEIAPEIRALMGEYGDPLLNYARTVSKMAGLVAKHHFLQDVKAKGMGEFLFDRPTGKYSVPIAAEGSKTMAPLNGLYTTPEIAETFKEFNSMEPMGEFLKIYMKFNGWIKAGKTIFSVMTHARNFVGNLGFVMANGHYRIDKFGKAAQVAFANVHSNDKAVREKFQEYIQLGIVQDSGAAGELKNYIQDIRDNKDFFERINDNRLKKVKEGALDVTQNLYQFEDDIYKIYAFENEYARYKKAYPQMDDQELKEKCAKIVRDTYPTYSMVPKMVKKFRANPLLGTFVSFPAEVLRTTYNTVALAKEELSNPSTRSIGAQRAAGIMMAAMLPTAASYASMALLGLDGQDDEDLRKFVAPWQKNSEFLYLGVNDDKYRVIDMGFSDPHSYLKRPIYDLLNGKDLQSGSIEAMSTLAQPFISEELLASRLLDWKRNKKETGDHVYNPDTPLGDQVADVWHHIQTAAEPGTVSSMRRIIKAAGGETDKYGNKFELQNEVVGLFSGQKQEVKDISQALLFRAYELKDRVDLTEKELFRVTKNKAATDEEKKLAKERHDVAIENIANDALNIYFAAIRLGVDPKEARKTMYRTKSPVIVKKIKQ
jgi:hypothetical protein